MIDWAPYARRLAQQLADAGEIRDPVWQRVFSAVPRHVFVPRFFEQLDAWRWQQIEGADPIHQDRWLAAVYSDRTLVTALADVLVPNEYGGHDKFPVAVSSSTTPGLMARMLEDLDLSEHDRVLEIGTGTGYNAALLSQRLADRQVYSVDLRPDLIESARDRLASAGFRPMLAAGDGTHGLPGDGPFDRIIATCCVRYIPGAWIEQLRPQGRLITDIEGSLGGGNLAILRRRDKAIVEGRFCARYGGFMPMQHQLGINPDAAPSLSRHPEQRGSTISPQVLHRHNSPALLFIQVHLPADTQLRLTTNESATATRLIAPDGSWCDVSHDAEPDGRHHVTEAGPTDLWRVVEAAYQRYIELGEPEWSRFGITASPQQQHVWLDSPRTGPVWPLGLANRP